MGTLCFGLHGTNYVFPSCEYWNSWHWHWVIQCGYALCFGIVFPVMDGMALEYLHRQGESKDYGKERLYGAIFWGITNLFFGPLIDQFGFVVAYACAFFACVVSLSSIAYYAQGQANASPPTLLDNESFEQNRVTSDPKVSENGRKDMATQSTSFGSESDISERSFSLLQSISSFQHQSEHIVLVQDSAKTHMSVRPTPTRKQWNLLPLVLGTPYGAAFILTYFILASGLSVVENMVFLFFEFLGGSNTLCGITVALTVMFEIPIFHIAPSLLRQYGVGVLLIAANLAFVVRILGYTLIPKGQLLYILLLEPLHGITYACSQSSAVEFVAQRMPPGAEASGQGLVNLVRGSGSILGLSMGGILQETLGPRTMYRIFALAITLSMTFFSWIRCKDQREEHYDRIVEVLV